MQPTHPHVPPPLRMDDNTFAYQTMTERMPQVIRAVQANNSDYNAGIQRALDRLHDGLVNDAPMPRLSAHPVPPPDYAAWEAAYQAQRGDRDTLTWLGAEWFFAETFFFRHIIAAVRWHETGRDPFAPQKQAEFATERYWDQVDAALAVEGDFAERLGALLAFALWGNRADLSHPAGSLASEDAADDDLLVDERAALVAHITSGSASAPRAIHIIADNAGMELTMDLVLTDHLLADERFVVVLHTKAHPTYVSDTTTPDVWHTLDELYAHGGAPAALAQRLRATWQLGRWRILSHPCWTSSAFLSQMPPLLRKTLSTAHLVLLKGDANYRRAVSDALWSPEVTFAQVMDYFPVPLAALRSLKSDALVGVDAARRLALDAQSDNWRTTGRYGVIQFAGR